MGPSASAQIAKGSDLQPQSLGSSPSKHANRVT
jgi:hypothetical protein